MSIEYSWQNRTVCGYHSKDSNQMGIIENGHPILTKENDAIFLITRDHFFTVSTPQIKKVIYNFLRYQKFNNVKRVLANSLVVPGFVIAILYILNTLQLPFIPAIITSFIDSGIASFLFGISIISVIALWHDYYHDKSHPIRLPKTQNIPQKEIDDIKATGFKFGRYSHFEAISFANEIALTVLCKNIEKEIFNTFTTFQDILELPEIQEINRRANIDITNMNLEKQKITQETFPSYPLTSLRSLLIYTLEEALLTNSNEIKPEHIYLTFAKVFPAFQKVLQTNNCSLDLLREITRYRAYKEDKEKRTQILNPNIPYFKKGGIAESWVYGYTFILDKFSNVVNDEVAEQRDIYGVGHTTEIENLISIIGKVSNKNALLIGEPGVGKSSLVEGLAQQINSGSVPEQIKDKRIIKLDINGLISISSQSSIEELIKRAMAELESAGDVILFIDEIQELIPTKAEASGHSLAGIMLPYILDSNFPVIGTVNYSDYKKYFYSNESLRQSFTNVEVKELSTAATLQILETKIDLLEKNYKCFITFPALISAVELSDRYIKEKNLPSSAVEAIEIACAWAQNNNVDVLTDQQVSKAISQHKNIPIANIDAEESTKLMKLEDQIKSKVIGQDEAIHKIVEALRRARTDIRNPNKPIGAFLFIGPTGVGKTHLAKTVAQEYFGEGNDIVRLDMSEYQDIQSIEKLLGSNDSTSSGQSKISLIDKVKSNPYTVVLFDEIEKAHPNVLDLFLQLFDEGRLTSNQGETVDFTNTIIICTSNIGSRILLESLQQKDSPWDVAKDKALLEVRQSLRPELINRFDDIIIFHPHTLENLSQIATLLLSELAKRLNTKGLLLKWGTQIPMLIANKANEPGFGARPLKRYVQDSIEGRIAKEMIEQKVSSGSEIEIKESWINETS